VAEKHEALAAASGQSFNPFAEIYYSREQRWTRLGTRRLSPTARPGPPPTADASGERMSSVTIREGRVPGIETAS